MVEKNKNHIGMYENTFYDKESQSTLLEQGIDAQKWLMSHTGVPVTTGLVCRGVEGEMFGEVILPARAL